MQRRQGDTVGNPCQWEPGQAATGAKLSRLGAKQARADGYSEAHPQRAALRCALSRGKQPGTLHGRSSAHSQARTGRPTRAPGTMRHGTSLRLPSSSSVRSPVADASVRAFGRTPAQQTDSTISLTASGAPKATALPVKAAPHGDDRRSGECLHCLLHKVHCLPVEAGVVPRRSGQTEWRSAD